MEAVKGSDLVHHFIQPQHLEPRLPLSALSKLIDLNTDWIKKKKGLQEI